MTKLLKYMNGYRKECILSPLFKMLEAFFELLVPFVVAYIIDTAIPAGKNGDTSSLIISCLIMAGLGAIGLTCTIFAQYFAAKAAVGFTSKIKHSLFEHITSLSYTEIDTLGTSTLITRMTSDANQVQTGVNLTLRLFMRSPVIVFGAMIMAFVVDTEAKAALVFVGAIPALAIVVFGIMCATIPLYKKVQTRLDGVLGSARENLTGIRVIRAFGLEKNEQEKFKTKTEDLNKAQKVVGAISAIMNPLTYAIVNIAIVVLLYVGNIEVDAGALTTGQLVALYNYMSQILIELIKLANLIITITKALASANRIEAVFEIKSSQEIMELEGGDPQYAVEFRNAYLKYASSPEYSLEDIDFTVSKGETVGIIGGTGSGKTSLINMIGRFYDAEKGEVFVNGKNVKSYQLDTLREMIGMTPQKAVLFKGTLRENLQWGDKTASDEEIINAIEIAQAKDVLDSKSEGLDFVVEQGGKNLSGGQRQRFTIARALVGKPEIIVLDDSSSALDYLTDLRLRTAIADIDYKPTVFIVSQRTASIQNADKIIVLDDGKIVGMGKHDGLLKNCPVYAEIYASQFKKGGEE
ncbi:MAG: ABC transporter ATP-binding protein [Clostridia bacterium]|nr:ABC transporter ATP-binding protein [Clostridia bacterium]